MNYKITLAALGSYNILACGQRLASIILENSGANAVVYGTIPPPALVFSGKLTTGSAVVTKNPEVAGNWQARDVVEGMSVTGTGIPANTTVLSVVNDQITLSANATTTDPVDLTFGFPAIDATTGITLAAGARVELVAYEEGMLQQGLRLYSTAGSTVKIFKRLQ